MKRIGGEEQSGEVRNVVGQEPGHPGCIKRPGVHYVYLGTERAEPVDDHRYILLGMVAATRHHGSNHDDLAGAFVGGRLQRFIQIGGAELIVAHHHLVARLPAEMCRQLPGRPVKRVILLIARPAPHLVLEKGIALSVVFTVAARP